MADQVQIACTCGGHNGACVNCGGSGQVNRPACKRCGGSGTEAHTEKSCLDCRGAGWRSIDVQDPAN